MHLNKKEWNNKPNPTIEYLVKNINLCGEKKYPIEFWKNQIKSYSGSHCKYHTIKDRSKKAQERNNLKKDSLNRQSV